MALQKEVTLQNVIEFISQNSANGIMKIDEIIEKDIMEYDLEGIATISKKRYKCYQLAMLRSEITENIEEPLNIKNSIMPTEIKTYNTIESIDVISKNILPDKSGVYSLGSQELSLDNVYSINGVTNTSDVKLKNNIKNLSVNALDFINNLKVIEYKLNNGKSGRTHIGYDARQCKENINKNLNKDYAFYVEENGIAGIRNHELSAVQTEAIKELNVNINEIKDNINNELSKIKTELENIKSNTFKNKIKNILSKKIL